MRVKPWRTDWRAHGGWLADEAVTRYLEGPKDAVSSLLADRLAGRPLEIDARNGVIVRVGERYWIATPLNRMAVTVLEASVARDVPDA